MTDEVQRLTTLLEARITSFEKNMAKARATGTREFSAIRQSSKAATAGMQTDMVKATERINQAMASTSTKIGTFGRAFGALAALAGVKGFQELADSATNINNALKVAGLSGTALTTTLGQLYDVALKNHTPIESLSQLYSRLSLNQKELGKSSGDLINFSDLVGKGLRVSGTSATEAAGPMLQLSQALGSGTVHAEEFNSIVEGMPALAQAAAKGIKQANGSVAELKNLVNNGQLSSLALFDGIAAGASDLDIKLQGSKTTIGQAMTDLRTSLTRAADNFNTMTGSAEKTAELLEGLARGLAGIDFGPTVAGINGIIGALNTAIAKAGSLWAKLTGLATAMNNGNPLTDLAPPGNSEKEILDLYNQSLSAGKQQISNSEKLLDLEQQRAKILSQYGKDHPIGSQMLKSVEDEISSIQTATTRGKDELAPAPTKTFATPHGHAAPTMPAPEIVPIDTDDKKYKTTGSKKAGAGGGGRTSVPKTANDRLNADLQSIRDRTAALKEEESAIGLSYEEQTKRQTALELEQKALADLREEARRKGQTDLDAIQLSPDKIAAIEKESAAYAAQADELRKVKEQQAKAEDAADEFYGSFKSSMIGAIEGTNSFSDALNQLLKKLEDMVLNSVFDSLFKPATSTSSGGLFGSAFSGIGKLLGFADGTDYAPGGIALVGERGPEVVNLPRGSQVVPNHKLGSLGSGGGSQEVKVSVGVSVDENGNLQAYVKNVAQSEGRSAASSSIKAYDKALPDRIAQVKRNPDKR